jgi:hypothetical protein
LHKKSQHQKTRRAHCMALTLDPISVANRQQHPNSISTTTFLRQLNPFSQSSGKNLSHFSSNEIFDLEIHVSFYASPCSASYARKSADYNSFEIFCVFFKFEVSYLCKKISKKLFGLTFSISRARRNNGRRNPR